MSRVAVTTAVLVLSLALATVHATDYVWNGVPNAVWNVATNWLPNTGTPSAASDTATINTGIVVVNTNVAIATITLGGAMNISSTVTVTLSAGLDMNNAANSYIAGFGTLTLACGGASSSRLQGTIVNTKLTLNGNGCTVPSTGAGLVIGSNATLTTGGAATTGFAVAGNLLVQNFAVLQTGARVGGSGSISFKTGVVLNAPIFTGNLTISLGDSVRVRGGVWPNTLRSVAGPATSESVFVAETADLWLPNLSLRGGNFYSGSYQFNISNITTVSSGLATLIRSVGCGPITVMGSTNILGTQSAGYHSLKIDVQPNMLATCNAVTGGRGVLFSTADTDSLGAGWLSAQHSSSKLEFDTGVQARGDFRFPASAIIQFNSGSFMRAGARSTFARGDPYAAIVFNGGSSLECGVGLTSNCGSSITGPAAGQSMTILPNSYNSSDVGPLVLPCGLSTAGTVYVGTVGVSGPGMAKIVTAGGSVRILTPGAYSINITAGNPSISMGNNQVWNAGTPLRIVNNNPASAPQIFVFISQYADVVYIDAGPLGTINGYFLGQSTSNTYLYGTVTGGKSLYTGVLIAAPPFSGLINSNADSTGLTLLGITMTANGLAIGGNGPATCQSCKFYGTQQVSGTGLLTLQSSTFDCSGFPVIFPAGSNVRIEGSGFVATGNSYVQFAGTTVLAGTITSTAKRIMFGATSTFVTSTAVLSLSQDANVTIAATQLAGSISATAGNSYLTFAGGATIAAETALTVGGGSGKMWIAGSTTPVINGNLTVGTGFSVSAPMTGSGIVVLLGGSFVGTASFAASLTLMGPPTATVTTTFDLPGVVLDLPSLLYWSGTLSFSSRMAGVRFTGRTVVSNFLAPLSLTSAYASRHLAGGDTSFGPSFVTSGTIELAVSATSLNFNAGCAASGDVLMFTKPTHTVGQQAASVTGACADAGGAVTIGFGVLLGSGAGNGTFNFFGSANGNEWTNFYGVVNFYNSTVVSGFKLPFAQYVYLQPNCIITTQYSVPDIVFSNFVALGAGLITLDLNVILSLNPSNPEFKTTRSMGGPNMIFEVRAAKIVVLSGGYLEGTAYAGPLGGEIKFPSGGGVRASTQLTLGSSSSPAVIVLQTGAYIAGTITFNTNSVINSVGAPITGPGTLRLNGGNIWAVTSLNVATVFGPTLSTITSTIPSSSCFSAIVINNLQLMNGTLALTATSASCVVSFGNVQVGPAARFTTVQPTTWNGPGFFAGTFVDGGSVAGSDVVQTFNNVAFSGLMQPTGTTNSHLYVLRQSSVLNGRFEITVNAGTYQIWLIGGSGLNGETFWTGGRVDSSWPFTLHFENHTFVGPASFSGTTQGTIMLTNALMPTPGLAPLSYTISMRGESTFTGTDSTQQFFIWAQGGAVATLASSTGALLIGTLRGDGPATIRAPTAVSVIRLICNSVGQFRWAAPQSPGGINRAIILDRVSIENTNSYSPGFDSIQISSMPQGYPSYIIFRGATSGIHVLGTINLLWICCASGFFALNFVTETPALTNAPRLTFGSNYTFTGLGPFTGNVSIQSCYSVPDPAVSPTVWHPKVMLESPPTCFAVDLCASSPCPGAQLCTQTSGSAYTCSCPTGLTGNNCQTNLNECASSPCANGGTCVDGLATYTCTCTGTGFTGPQCLTPTGGGGGVSSTAAGGGGVSSTAAGGGGAGISSTAVGGGGGASTAAGGGASTAAGGGASTAGGGGGASTAASASTAGGGTSSAGSNPTAPSSSAAHVIPGVRPGATRIVMYFTGVVPSNLSAFLVALTTLLSTTYNAAITRFFVIDVSAQLVEASIGITLLSRAVSSVSVSPLATTPGFAVTIDVDPAPSGSTESTPQQLAAQIVAQPPASVDGVALSTVPVTQLCSDGVQRATCPSNGGGGGGDDSSDGGVIAGLSLIIVIIIAAGIVVLVVVSLLVCWKYKFCCFRSKMASETRTNLELSSAL